jgi:peptidoglycan-N-acetylglucosamine deacetylase
MAVLGLSALVAGGYAAWRLADSRTFQFAGELVHRVESGAPVVALTFDDGPTLGGTESILEILEREGVRATFFFTGAELVANPGLGPRFVEAGHELGNHTYSHSRMLFRTPSFIRREVEVTDSLIRQTGYSGPIHFRPPYGKKLLGLPLYLARTGRTTIMWDVEPDSHAEVAQSAQRIVAHVLDEVRPGSIILLHVMYPSRRESLAAVEGVIRGLKGRGYRLVTVSELLGPRGEPRSDRAQARPYGSGGRGSPSDGSVREPGWRSPPEPLSTVAPSDPYNSSRRRDPAPRVGPDR